MEPQDVLGVRVTFAVVGVFEVGVVPAVGAPGVVTTKSPVVSVK